jgi:hypothetical protein
MKKFFYNKHYKEEQIRNNQNPNRNFVKSKYNPYTPMEYSRSNNKSPCHFIFKALNPVIINFLTHKSASVKLETNIYIYISKSGTHVKVYSYPSINTYLYHVEHTAIIFTIQILLSLYFRIHPRKTENKQTYREFFLENRKIKKNLEIIKKPFSRPK